MKYESGFEFLEHTADILIRAKGKDYSDTVRQSALAMFSVITDNKKEIDEFIIEERAENLEELTVYFLSSILSEIMISRIAPANIEILQFKQEENRIKAKIVGERGAKFKDDIKAVTFHELKVKKSKEGYIVEVLFDV